MLIRTLHTAIALGTLVITGCASSAPTPSTDPPSADRPARETSPPDASTSELPPPPPPGAERPAVTRAQCEEQGGQVIGDPGDGSVHRDDFRCEDGSPPFGTIQPAAGEPIAIEGAVCCG